MAQKYARGMHAWGICGRSGRKMLLKDMVFDERYPNMRVDPDWFEGKHPQELMPKVEDPVALYRPAVEVIDAPSTMVLTLSAPPVPPPVLSVTVVAGPALDLTWTVDALLAAEVASYRIYRATNNGAYTLLNTVAAPTQVYVDTTVTGGNTYGYFVVGVSTNGSQTAISNILSANGTIVDTYATPGAVTWSKRPNAVLVTAKAVGAGAGGGGCDNSKIRNPGGGVALLEGHSGGGGGYAKSTYLPSALPNTVNVFVGTPGAGATADTQSNGVTNDGTASWFGGIPGNNPGFYVFGGGTSQSGGVSNGGVGQVLGGTGVVTGTGGGGQARSDGVESDPPPGAVYNGNPGSNGAPGGGGNGAHLLLPNGNPPTIGTPTATGGASTDAGTGGAGGVAATLPAGGAGQNGGFPGGGGGGGSPGSNPLLNLATPSGAGGTGGGGVVIVTTFLW